jgi:hypothetical protein
MKKYITRLAIVNLIAAVIVVVPVQSRAQDATSTNAPAVAPAVAPATAPPVTPAPTDLTTNAPVKKVKKHDHSVGTGKVSMVDTNAMTITIGKHTYDITSETKINKNGEPAILSDIAVGDKVGVAYKKTADGTLDAMTVNDGKKPEAGK